MMYILNVTFFQVVFFVFPSGRSVKSFKSCLESGDNWYQFWMVTEKEAKLQQE